MSSVDNLNRFVERFSRILFRSQVHFMNLCCDSVTAGQGLHFTRIYVTRKPGVCVGCESFALLFIELPMLLLHILQSIGGATGHAGYAETYPRVKYDMLCIRPYF